MIKKKDKEIPEFKSLEEEREYWEKEGALAEGHRGRTNRPKTEQKRSSSLAVRLTGKELTALRDLAAQNGVGPSTFARMILTSAIEYGGMPPKRVSLGDLNAFIQSAMPQHVIDKGEEIAEKISIGSDPQHPIILIDGSQMEAVTEFAQMFVGTLLSIGNVELIKEEDSRYTEVKELVDSKG